MPRIPVGRFFAVLLAPGGGLALFVPAAGAGCRIGPRHLIEASRRGMTGCASPPPQRDRLADLNHQYAQVTEGDTVSGTHRVGP